MANDNLDIQLTELLQQMQNHVQADIADGTVIPGRYQEIQGLLDRAKVALKSGDTNTTLDIIGEINLDALDEVHELDGIIGEIIQQLRDIQRKCSTDGINLPEAITEELKKLKIVLDFYHK